ncbi:MAG: LacI family DNA-binding transcriptional regulator [Mesorhizobium sp.]|uniref:LacI family DNA-binding transcriptional regulator n=1 Tax=Mesorhizobium sp. TaxID=1871066 RepID=UPI000FE66A81|nr:LacI family DNA-binding transcriptional regulator [Mesorhizobium sp.]RWI24014.1 MAG: LacI family DNA-binding transcriptional regulator [Mesorhizobium sp.]RWK51464.1 MAG: LacI family DNA-binding transcriptional regulator [Mesorhizobium sp.]RWK96227.1 MAG: LacI family DNA-binding transcriptional regulator [Mesorhizobium sp.]RWL08845.1 MAG: LacI family DNA-binding transcriptional regulator [Mesorhizobium sp.]TIP60955.1 MAG: LacI family DNA-binding transcriptional regulator [Mesorhizobium sp.]
MRRPTIRDLAQAAGVSVATVNRILSGTVSVRPKTVQRVQSAAEEIGFYGIGAIDDRAKKLSPHHRFGFLLQQSTRELYKLFGKKIIAACRDRRDEIVEPIVEFVDLLTPETISSRLIALGDTCDVVGVIAPDHPIIGQAIRSLKEMGKPVVAYITDQSAPERAAYVGTDNWKLGRTAAFLIAQTTQGPGRIAVFIGNHRYQCQDVSDASFRSYLREHAPRLTVEESRPTHEESSEAYRMVAELLKTTDDLVGILIVGGGITGVLRALREVPAKRRAGIKLVCRDIGPDTRKGLSEGMITAALCHPLEATSALLVQTMIDVIGPQAPVATLQRSIPFEIVTPENI